MIINYIIIKENIFSISNTKIENKKIYLYNIINILKIAKYYSNNLLNNNFLAKNKINIKEIETEINSFYKNYIKYLNNEFKKLGITIQEFKNNYRLQEQKEVLKQIKLNEYFKNIYENLKSEYSKTIIKYNYNFTNKYEINISYLNNNNINYYLNVLKNVKNIEHTNEMDIDIYICDSIKEIKKGKENIFLLNYSDSKSKEKINSLLIDLHQSR